MGLTSQASVKSPGPQRTQRWRDPQRTQKEAELSDSDGRDSRSQHRRKNLFYSDCQA